MSRVIKARALTDKHLGQLATHSGAPTPLPLVGISQSLTFVYLIWGGPGPQTATSVALDADITLYDAEEAT